MRLWADLTHLQEWKTSWKGTAKPSVQAAPSQLSKETQAGSCVSGTVLSAGQHSSAGILKDPFVMHLFQSGGGVARSEFSDPLKWNDMIRDLFYKSTNGINGESLSLLRDHLLWSSFWPDLQLNFVFLQAFYLYCDYHYFVLLLVTGIGFMFQFTFLLFRKLRFSC